MAKNERTPVDWAKPIEHVVASVKITYGGVIKTDSEFKHLILCGDDESPMMVDDFGCVKAKAPVNRIQRVRNVVEKPDSGLLQPFPDISGPVAELTVAIESLHDMVDTQIPGLREALIKATAAMVRVAESFGGSVTDLRKLAVEQQTAYLNANTMLIEELRKELPKSEPAVGETPPPAKPKPIAIVRDIAELGKAAGGSAEIKNFGHLETKAARETVQTLAMATGVKRIIVGGFSHTRSGKDGVIKYNHEEGHGLKATVYGKAFAYELFIACERADRHALIGVIEYMNRETSAAR